MPVIEFVQSYQMLNRAIYHPGERAVFSDEEAQRACQAHVAVLVEDAKQFTPPHHKQIRHAKQSK